MILTSLLLWPRACLGKYVCLPELHATSGWHTSSVSCAMLYMCMQPATLCWAHLREHDYLAALLFMHLDDSVHDRDVTLLEVEDHHFASPEGLFAHMEEQNVSPPVSRLHAAAEHHHNLQCTCD